MKNCPACGQATPKKMAKGGGAEGAEKEYVSGPSAPTEGAEPTPDVAAAAEGTDPEETDEEEAPAPAPLETAASSPAAPAAAAPSPLAPTAPAAPKDVVPAPDNTIPVIGEKRPETVPMPSPPAPMTAQEMAEEHQSFDQDLAASHIHPKTYNDLLWNDKSTPGKIGSIFGLMLSGMGSGLAHQPNMLMAMMDKTIDNDLNAQKATAEGARNLYNLHLQHQDMRSRLQHNYYASALEAASANLKPSEKKRIEAQTQEALASTKRANAETAGINTKNAMLTGALKALTGSVGNMPQGPAQQQATGILNNVVAPAVNGQIQNNIQQGAAKTQLIQATAPYPAIPQTGKAPDPNAPIADFNKLNALSMGGVMPEVVNEATKEAGLAQQTRSMAGMYDNAFKNLNTMDAGQTGEKVAAAFKILGPLVGPVAEAALARANPMAAMAGALGGKAADPVISNAADTIRKFQQWRAAQIGTLGPMISRATAGRYNEAEAASQADSLFPSVYDMGDEKTRKSKFDNGMAWIKSQEITPSLDRLGAKLSPFPNYQYQAMEKEKQPERKETPRKKKDEAPETMGPSPPPGTMVNLKMPSPFAP